MRCLYDRAAHAADAWPLCAVRPLSNAGGALRGRRIGLIREPMRLAPGQHPRRPIAPAAAHRNRSGFTEAVRDVAALNARSNFRGDDQRAAFRNREDVADLRHPPDHRQGVNECIRLRELLRRVDTMVLVGNSLDALVRLQTRLCPARWRCGRAGQPSNWLPETRYGPNAGLTEGLIPAGYETTSFEPVFRPNADCTRHEMVHSDVATPPDPHGLPFSLALCAEPGREDVLLQIAPAYEAASERRIPPLDFGQLSIQG